MGDLSHEARTSLVEMVGNAQGLHMERGRQPPASGALSAVLRRQKTGKRKAKNVVPGAKGIKSRPKAVRKALFGGSYAVGGLDLQEPCGPSSESEKGLAGS